MVIVASGDFRLLDSIFRERVNDSVKMFFSPRTNIHHPLYFSRDQQRVDCWCQMAWNHFSIISFFDDIKDNEKGNIMVFWMKKSAPLSIFRKAMCSSFESLSCYANNHSRRQKNVPWTPKKNNNNWTPNSATSVPRRLRIPLYFHWPLLGDDP